MKKLKLISGVSVTLLSCAFGNLIAQAGPVKPNLKSTVFKIVGGNQVSPSDLTVEQRTLWTTTPSGSRLRSPSPSNINPDDGQLPSTSAAAFSSSSSTFEGSSTTILTEGPSTSGGVTPKIPKGMEHIVRSVDLTTGAFKTRRQARASLLMPGEAVYKPTHSKEEGRVRGGVPRPHLVVHVQESRTRANSTDLFIVDMSNTKGKEHKAEDFDTNYLLNPKDPNFSGNDSNFIKLTKFRKVTVTSNERQKLLGKVVDPEDLEKIRKIFGFKN